MKSWEWTDWLLEVWGAVGARKVELGSEDALADWEMLLSILGWTEYCISNAGDFANMEDVRPDFQRDATEIAGKLSLPLTRELFSQSESSLLENFDGSFDDVCFEIANFIGTLPESGSVGDVSRLWAEKCLKKS